MQTKADIKERSKGVYCSDFCHQWINIEFDQKTIHWKALSNGILTVSGWIHCEGSHQFC
jgi:hypothetical protein